MMMQDATGQQCGYSGDNTGAGAGYGAAAGGADGYLQVLSVCSCLRRAHLACRLSLSACE